MCVHRVLPFCTNIVSGRDWSILAYDVHAASDGWLEAFTTADIHQNIGGLAWVFQGAGWLFFAIGVLILGWTALVSVPSVLYHHALLCAALQ